MKRRTAWHVTALTIVSAAHVSSVSSQSCCALPDGEETVAAYGSGQYTHFKQRVSHANGLNFNLAKVREGNGTGGTSFDSCWFEGSERAKFESVTGGEWEIGGPEVYVSQQWGYDTLGWGLLEIMYYRAQRPARGLPMPCETNIMQKMEMYCPPSWDAYTQSNILTMRITSTTVVNCRTDISNSSCETKPF